MIACPPNAPPVYQPPEPSLDELAIHPEISKLLPPLAEAEYSQLKQNVLRDGRFTDPILVWHDAELRKDVVLDGHNRRSLWSEVKDQGIDPPRVERLEFADLNEVKEWVLNHQIGKRNITPLVASSLIGVTQWSSEAGAGVLARSRAVDYAAGQTMNGRPTLYERTALFPQAD